MRVAALLARLRAAGLTVTERGGKVAVGPACGVTDELAGLVRADRDGLLAELRREADLAWSDELAAGGFDSWRAARVRNFDRDWERLNNGSDPCP